VFDYIEQFYNPRRRHSTLGHLSPVAFKERQRSAQLAVPGTGSWPELQAIPSEQDFDGVLVFVEFRYVSARLLVSISSNPRR